MMWPVDTVPSNTVGSTEHAPVKVPSVLRCGLTILVLKLSLTVLGFARTLSLIRHRVDPVSRLEGTDVNAVKAAEHAVAMAGAFYPGRALCLEQSLALYYLLRRQGIPVTYCQGVQAHPFAAHAWVEYDGVVINDVGERVRPFARLPGLLP